MYKETPLAIAPVPGTGFGLAALGHIYLGIALIVLGVALFFAMRQIGARGKFGA